MPALSCKITGPRGKRYQQGIRQRPDVQTAIHQSGQREQRVFASRERDRSLHHRSDLFLPFAEPVRDDQAATPAERPARKTRLFASPAAQALMHFAVNEASFAHKARRGERAGDRTDQKIVNRVWEFT